MLPFFRKFCLRVVNWLTTQRNFRILNLFACTNLFQSFYFVSKNLPNTFVDFHDSQNFHFLTKLKIIKVINQQFVSQRFEIEKCELTKVFIFPSQLFTQRLCLRVLNWLTTKRDFQISKMLKIFKPVLQGVGHKKIVKMKITKIWVSPSWSSWYIAFYSGLRLRGLIIWSLWSFCNQKCISSPCTDLV